MTEAFIRHGTIGIYMFDWFLTRVNQSLAPPYMAMEKEAFLLSRVHMYFITTQGNFSSYAGKYRRRRWARLQESGVKAFPTD